jgi:hypothetical protein
VLIAGPAHGLVAQSDRSQQMNVDTPDPFAVQVGRSMKCINSWSVAITVSSCRLGFRRESPGVVPHGPQRACGGETCSPNSRSRPASRGFDPRFHWPSQIKKSATYGQVLPFDWWWGATRGQTAYALHKPHSCRLNFGGSRSAYPINGTWRVIMGAVDFWSRHLAACQAQGVSINAYAKREGLSAVSLYYWRKRLGLAGSRRSPNWARRLPICTSTSPD